MRKDIGGEAAGRFLGPTLPEMRSWPIWLALWLWACRVSAIPYVVYDGYAWATLDAAEPTDSGDTGCQTDTGSGIDMVSLIFLRVPDGWQLAPDTAGVRANVIGAYRWGTQVLVVKTGAQYWTANADRYIDTVPGQYCDFCGSNGLRKDLRAWCRVTRCHARILIYQELTQELPTTTTQTKTTMTMTLTTSTATSTDATDTTTSTVSTTSEEGDQDLFSGALWPRTVSGLIGIWISVIQGLS